MFSQEDIEKEQLKVQRVNKFKEKWQHTYMMPFTTCEQLDDMGLVLAPYSNGDDKNPNFDYMCMENYEPEIIAVKNDRAAEKGEELPYPDAKILFGYNDDSFQDVFGDDVTVDIISELDFIFIQTI